MIDSGKSISCAAFTASLAEAVLLQAALLGGKPGLSPGFIGHSAAGILMDPEGARAFIACSPDNYLAVVDLKTLEVTSHLDVGGDPDGLAWAVQP